MLVYIFITRVYIIGTCKLRNPIFIENNLKVAKYFTAILILIIIY